MNREINMQRKILKILILQLSHSWVIFKLNIDITCFYQELKESSRRNVWCFWKKSWDYIIKLENCKLGKCKRKTAHSKQNLQALNLILGCPLQHQIWRIHFCPWINASVSVNNNEKWNYRWMRGSISNQCSFKCNVMNLLEWMLITAHS